MGIKGKINLNNLGWIIFILFLGLNIISIFRDIQGGIIYRALPFKIDHGKAVAFQDSALVSQFSGVEIVKINTLQIRQELTEVFDTDETDIDINIVLGDVDNAAKKAEEFQLDISNAIAGKSEVQVSFKKDDITRNTFVKTNLRLNNSKMIMLAINIFFLLFIFFNSFLLLKYSIAKENILIVLFLLFLSSPSNLSFPVISLGMGLFSVTLSGPLFYHFILKKVASKRSPLLIYLFSIIIAGAAMALVNKYNALSLISYIWSVVWILIAFIVLWKTYKKTSSIDLKRLINAFSGIFITLIAACFLTISAVLLSMTTDGLQYLNGQNVQTIIIIVIMLLSLLVAVLGILWFFGAFTWSMLTGTALGVKIRSTMIISIVGVFFVTLFGFIDYTLGELLQTIFGRFMGSEFIAGIPATIGLLLFFNPVRRKVENVVDKKLNTSDLNFLESTHTFTETLADEGVIEGFEEYICENLIARLPITKVALISYDTDMHDFKFNEIRGSKVIENSAVQDIEGLLIENKIHRISNPIHNTQDSSSFALVIPIIYDNTDRWFIAFGSKKDGSSYNRRDEDSIVKLTDRIRLSLKFILAYEGMMNRKFQLQLAEKEQEIEDLRLKLEQLPVL